ncbi:hypothetical protein M0802_007802 [Mischocyttarus mexicanus]|nr:hypothetical protein M0802_007802 [Mischocyttarus mexicanus]
MPTFILVCRLPGNNGNGNSNGNGNGVGSCSSGAGAGGGGKRTVTQFIARNLGYWVPHCHRTRFFTRVALNCHVIVVIYLPVEFFNPEVLLKVVRVEQGKESAEEEEGKEEEEEGTRRRLLLGFTYIIDDFKATVHSSLLATLCGYICIAALTSFS